MTTATEDRAAFLAERRTGIGGSDAAAILGLSPFATPQDVFLEKQGLALEQEETAAMRWGNLLEDPVAQEYATQTGRKIRRARVLRRHRKHPHMICHLDRTVDREDRIVEVKTVGKWADLSEWGETGTAQVPVYYNLQAQHNMVVTGAAVCDMPVLIAGQDFRIYSIPADPEIAAALIEAEAEFWAAVEKFEAPPATTLDQLRQRFPVSFTGEVVEVDDELRDLIRTRCAYVEAAKAYQDQIDEIDVQLQARMGTAEAIVETRVDKKGVAKQFKLATWKAQASFRFDAKAHRAQYPDVHSHFMVPSPSRPFLVTAEGKKLVPQKEATDVE